jgi:hypothetical protein
MVLIAVRFSGNFKDRFHLIERQYREVTGEQQEEHEENSNGSDENSDVDESWVEHAPRRWNVIAVG